MFHSNKHDAGFFGESKPMSKDKESSDFDTIHKLKQKVADIINSHWSEIEAILEGINVGIYFPKEEDNFPEKFKGFMMIVISANQLSASICAGEISKILEPAFKQVGLDNYWIGTNQKLVAESRESPPTSPVFHVQKLPMMIKFGSKLPIPSASDSQRHIANTILKGMQPLSEFIKSTNGITPRQL